MSESRQRHVDVHGDAARSEMTWWRRVAFGRLTLARVAHAPLERAARWIASGWTGAAPARPLPPSLRFGMLASGLLLLGGATWLTLAGGVAQLSPSMTPGQRIETALQFVSGLLSALGLITCVRGRPWRARVLGAWAIALSATAGLSSLVWGPPMLSVGLVFAGGAALLALITTRLLRAGLAD